MALDRQSIEKRDFPIGRRGYEADAVDAHLAQIAKEVDSLRSGPASRGGQSLAGTAAAQVQAIVEAAEQSAASIEREAQDEAARIREDASRAADSTRNDAISASQEHVSKVRESSSGMLARVDAMESELGALIESLRTGGNRLNADLALLEGNMGELYTASGDAGQRFGGGLDDQAPVGASEPETAPAPDMAPEAAATASGVPQTGDDEVADEADELGYEGAAEAAAEAETLTSQTDPATLPSDNGDGDEASAATLPEGDDVEGARLVALNMALNGQSRDETDRYLSENFELSDRDSLLDEVYATVE